MRERILVVDDDPVQRRLVENMVRKFGYEAIVAEGGDQAARILSGDEAAPIDCVILDLVMPDLDGFGLLARLRAHVRQRGADTDARQAARDVLRYFDMAAPLHHQDEELHVFPLLRAQASPEVQALVQRLQQDHLAMTADWAAARVPLLALAESAVAPFTPGDEAALDRFAQRYADHIAAEEGTAYPAAQALLAPATLGAMGQEMAARRGARYLL